MAPLNLSHTALSLARMGAHLRLSNQTRTRQGIAWAQSFLVSNFTDDRTFKQLQARFPTTRLEDRPVFHPLQLLNAFAIAFKVCAGGELRRPDIDARLRHSLGTALLMINDLLASDSEQEAILLGNEDDRRTHLMTQLVTPFEIMNPGQAWHLLFRSQVVYEELLHDRAVTSEISRTCRGFDFLRQFVQACGLPLPVWLNLVFACYANYLARSQEELAANPGLVIIDRRNFIRDTGVGQQEFDRFLGMVSRTIPEVRNELRTLARTDPRFDLIPFQTRPFFVLSEGNFACIDPGFLVPRLYTGPHWIIHDACPQARSDLFRAWGLLFQRYVNWLMVGMEKKPGRFLPFPAFSNGEESFDGILLCDGVLVALEYKGGFLNRAAKYSGIAQTLSNDIDKKIGEGCHQLATKIESLFNPYSARKRILADDVHLNSITKIVPVLVVQDQSLRTPFVNWWLNKYFRALVANITLPSGIEIQPLNVIHIEDFETMVESVDAGPFDFVYALRYRALRDPEMLSEFHNFMLGVRGYATWGSKRFREYDEKIQRRLFSYLFPKDSLLGIQRPRPS